MNEFLDSLPGDTLADKFYVTKLNDIILNSMPNSSFKQAYIQGFGCESFFS